MQYHMTIDLCAQTAANCLRNKLGIYIDAIDGRTIYFSDVSQQELSEIRNRCAPTIRYPGIVRTNARQNYLIHIAHEAATEYAVKYLRKHGIHIVGSDDHTILISDPSMEELFDLRELFVDVLSYPGIIREGDERNPHNSFHDIIDWMKSQTPHYSQKS